MDRVKLTKSQEDRIAARANLIMRRERDYCAFEVYVKMAISELTPAGRAALEAHND